MVEGVAATSQPSRLSVGAAIQWLALLLLLGTFGAVLLVLLALASLLTSLPGQTVGGVSAGLSSAAAGAAQTITSAERGVRDAFDPAHPPTGLSYDTEFSSLQTWRVGEQLPTASEYVLSVQAIRRREAADSPDTALYAVVHAELRQPRETRVLGQVVRSDKDPHDHVVYKGESFRIGRAIYRVNWVSQADSSLAAGAYRHPDAVSAPLKFAYD
jgi:hypothetical protein